MFGVEGGYGFPLGRVILRPQVGVGNAELTVSGNVGVLAAAGEVVTPADLQPFGTKSSLCFEPGVTVLFPIGIFLGGFDANLLVLPGLPEPTILHKASTGT